MSCEIIIPDQWSNEFEEFITKLNKQTRAKVTREIDLLSASGPMLPMPFVKKFKSNYGN